MRARLVLIGGAVAAALACDRAIAPERSPLAELRRQAPAGLGTFSGRVRVLDSSGGCRHTAAAVPGVRVEVGLWDGSPAFYRDTITRQPPAAPDDPRFHVVAHTITDAEGRFRFADMPRRVGYAMRVVPPASSPWRVAYGETLFGVPTGADLEDFPTLCVPGPEPVPGRRPLARTAR